MKKFSLICLIICLSWMTIKTIYGVGYAEGIKKANEEITIECKKDCAIKMDEQDEACYEAIERAKQEAKEEILEMF